MKIKITIEDLHKHVVSLHNKECLIMDKIEESPYTDEYELKDLLFDFDEEFSKLIDKWAIYRNSLKP